MGCIDDPVAGFLGMQDQTAIAEAKRVTGTYYLLPVPIA